MTHISIIEINVNRKRIRKEILSKLLKSKQAEFMAIYGRRRVEKTYLVKHLVKQFFEEQIVFSFTGSFETETNIQINNFWVDLKRVYPEAK